VEKKWKGRGRTVEGERREREGIYRAILMLL